MRGRSIRLRVIAVCVAAVTGVGVAPAGARAASGDLAGYRVKLTKNALVTLARQGYDVTEGRRHGKIDIAATSRQVTKLRKAGVEAEPVPGSQGGSGDSSTSSLRSLSIASTSFVGDDSPYTVWAKYDANPADSKQQYTEFYDSLAQQYPGIVRKKVIGKSVLGRDIVAVQITKGAQGADKPGRPAVLYIATQHAREWLATETCKREIKYFLSNYGQDTDAGHQATQLVDTTELWFVCVANPDGYEWTFTAGNRLWRKNLRDNNGDNQITANEDGVDPNRNFPGHWRLDDEGSSSDPASETYRGTGPASEPETQAMISLFDLIHPVFLKNEHTAASLILYPEGFQQDTPTADNPIYVGLAGTDENSAIKDKNETFDPDLSAELYITNGDTDDYSYHAKDILSYTTEGTPSHDPNVSGFEFEDNENQVQKEFLRHLPFTIDLAEASHNPVEIPGNQFGHTTPDFVLDTFKWSYGDPQTVQVTAKRKLGDVSLKYKINGGGAITKPTSEWGGGARYDIDDALYYRRLRGTVTGTSPGDTVEVWFTAGDKSSEHWTYTAARESDNKVLILSNEDYTGASPLQDGGPKYLKYFTDALSDSGVGYDTYNVDARSRKAPHPLGVLSHYKAVVWYTGDDVITREQGQPPGTASKLANDIQVAVRDFLNEGGKAFYSGKYAGYQFAFQYAYDPDQGSGNGDGPCMDPSDAFDGSLSECIPLQDDFLQYWLGAYTYVDDGGTFFENDEPHLFPMKGVANPFTGTTWTFGGADSAQNADHSASFVVTSSILDPNLFPTFADSRRMAKWLRPNSPYSPFTGSFFMAAGANDQSYKRLHREIDMTGKTSGALKFQISHDLEPDYDYVFVEAHTVGQDDWTTLPDTNGGTSTDTGQSCPSKGAGSDWQSLHPFLAHYQTKTNGGADCIPTGTTGSWNAATGNNGGWHEWNIDLTPYAGKKVEVSISVVTDPAVLGLGVWVDDTKVILNGQTVAETSFEQDLGGWTVGPPPPGTVSQKNGWERTDKALNEGPLVSTKNTLYGGFGFEGITGRSNRASFMSKAMQYLGIL
jgi:murein tripeptide amidase MpaA